MTTAVVLYLSSLNKVCKTSVRVCLYDFMHDAAATSLAEWIIDCMSKCTGFSKKKLSVSV